MPLIGLSYQSQSLVSACTINTKAYLWGMLHLHRWFVLLNLDCIYIKTIIMKLNHKIRRLIPRSELVFHSFDNMSDYYPIEYLKLKCNKTFDYSFAQRCRDIPSKPIVHRVIQNWIWLFDEISSIDFVDQVKSVKVMPFLNRVNLPQCELPVRRFIVKKFPSYSWLPEELDTSDFKKQDRGTAINFLKFNGLDHRIDPKLFVESLTSLLDTIKLDTFSRFKSFEEFTSGMNNQSSSGYPLFKRKGDADAISESKQFVERILDRGVDAVKEIFSLPTVVFHRFTPKVKTEEKIVKVKSRSVFGYPMSIIAISEMLHGRIIDNILLNHPFVIGKTRVQISEIMRQFRNSALQNSQIGVSWDIEQIDQKLPLSLQLLVHAILMTVNTDMDKGKFENLNLALAAYEVHGPSIGNWGTMMLNNGGTKSGTRYNTLTNSLVLLLASNYLTKVRNRADVVESVKITGDDIFKLFNMYNLYDQRERDVLLLQIKAVMNLFGLTVHPHKTYLCSPFELYPFLGMDWNIQSEPERPLSWIIAKLAYPEKFREEVFDERFVIRSCSILFQIVDGAKYFYQIVVPNVSWLKKSLKRQKDPHLTYYYTRDGPPIHASLPLSRFLAEGWRMF